MSVEAEIKKFRQWDEQLQTAIREQILGQDAAIEASLCTLLAGGHLLLVGVPGTGKTRLAECLSQGLGLPKGRIQFTPDLLPADILGAETLISGPQGDRVEFRKGPIFHPLIVADEINRGTPRTQSALLEAMQEGEVTAGGDTHSLDQPFIVLATQNPLEMDGTYPLPEAQLDRFLFKVHVPFPKRDELNEVLTRTTGKHEAKVEPVLNGEMILQHRESVRAVEAAPHVQDFAVRMLLSTHPDSEFATEQVQRWVRYGASPRGVQSLLLGAKVRAALDRRLHVSFDDIRQTAPAALRHRVLLGFEGEAEGIPVDEIVREVIEKTSEMMESGANDA